MDRLHAMTVFVEVAQRGGFAAAARALNVTPSAVTRAVSSLEDHLGVQLLVRTTRSVTLTTTGARYLADAKTLLADLAEAELRATEDQLALRGRVRVTAPRLFGRIYVVPAVLGFLDAHPDLVAEVRCVDPIVDIVAEGIDVAVRIGHLPDSSLKATKVGTVRQVVVAAPEYFEAHGTPSTPADLREHALLYAGAAPVGEAPVMWRFGEDDSKIEPRAFLGDSASALAGALAGHGITRVISYQAMPHVLAGRLRVILSDDTPVMPVQVVHIHGDRPPARVEKLVAHLRDRLRAEPLDVPR